MKTEDFNKLKEELLEIAKAKKEGKSDKLFPFIKNMTPRKKILFSFLYIGFLILIIIFSGILVYTGYRHWRHTSHAYSYNMIDSYEKPYKREIVSLL